MTPLETDTIKVLTHRKNDGGRAGVANGATPLLIVSEFFPPDPGGIQRSLELLAPAWGDDVRVITPVSQTSYPGLQRSLFSGRWRPRWGWLIAEFWRQARGGRRLIIFGHYSRAVTAAWLLRPFGVRYGILVHGHDVLSEQRGWFTWMVAGQLRRVEWVGVNSTWLAAKIHALGVPTARIVSTHPAVADTELKPVDQPRGDNIIVTVARLVPRKNIATVLRAVATLVPTWPTIQYHIIGDGPERLTLQQLADELHLGGHLTWHGQATEATRREVLRRASIFVLTPTIREGGNDIEGLGAVYLEAAAAGLPIVASPTGGIPDAVKNHRTGVLVDPENVNELAGTLATLLRDAAQRLVYGQAGRDLVAREFCASVRTARLAHRLNDWPAENQPIISVIIPAFNSARTIGSTLRSVWNQTWQNIEVILVNDGSTDNLEDVIKPWREKITYLTQANFGAPAARNRGAAAATGRWWLFLDADITLRVDALMTMATMLDAHPEAAYVYSDFKFGIKDFRLREFSASALKRMNYIHTSSLLRPAAWPGFDPTLKRFQDWDVWLTMLASGHRGLWIPQQLFRVADTGRMSRWLPSFVYHLPLIGRGIGNRNIEKYRAAEAAIRQKHRL